MRWLLLVLLAPSLALAAGPRVTSGSGSISTGPRILGEPSFAFELDALTQAEVTRAGWPVTTTRTGTATCIGGGTVAANVACVGTFGLECFASGTGGRTVGDVHTVSTAGWPVGAIDIRLRLRLPEAPTSGSGTRYLFDTSGSGTSGGIYFYINGTDAVAGVRNAALVADGTSGPFGLTAGEHEIRLHLSGGVLRAYRDGTLVASKAMSVVLDAHAPVAHIGGRSVGNHLNGSIRLLRVSQ